MREGIKGRKRRRRGEKQWERGEGKSKSRMRRVEADRMKRKNVEK